LCAIAAAVLVSACVAPAGRMPLTAGTGAGRTPVLRVQVREGTGLAVRRVPIEEYVAAALLSEVDPPEADPREIEAMFEVQAIIARTYAVSERGRHAREGFDLCSTTHCQLYEPARLRTSKWSALAREAAQRTAGRVLWYGGAAAHAVFHADCGGHTSSAGDVWTGAAPPYLRGLADGGPANGAHVRWTFAARADTLRDALNGDSRTRVGKRLDRIDVSARDSAGRAQRLTLHGARTLVVRGEVFREILAHAFGVKSLRSTLFEIHRRRETFEFTGRGYGHGVGLCQAGAFARIKAGATPAQVLAFYYPGTTLRSLSSASTN